MTTVTVHHPDIALLEPAVSLYEATHSGRWERIAATCSDELTDPVAAAENLRALAAATGWSFEDRNVPHEVDPAAGMLTLPVADALPVLDLFSRVLCGQWQEVAMACALGAGATDTTRHPYMELPGGVPLTQALRMARVAHQRRDGLWPNHPNADTGIAQGPMAAKLAYHAYKLLGGGTPGAPTFALCVPVTVTGGSDPARATQYAPF